MQKAKVLMLRSVQCPGALAIFAIVGEKSLPSLWDNIPRIYLSEGRLTGSSGLNRSYGRALIYLLQRSGTSPTLKLDFSRAFESRRMDYEGPTSIMKNIMLHSERIEQLCMEVNKTTMSLLQGFKGRLPNIRILRLRYYSVRVLLLWSQITHFEEQLPGERVGKVVLLSSSSLHSLTNLDILKPSCLFQVDESALLFPYRPTTLPDLRTLRIIVYHCDYKDVDLFLESLTIPAVEVMKIRYMGTLIPGLVSMFSGYRGPSRLHKLVFRTIPLQTGQLSALLKLTPHLVELDIHIPPAADLLRLIYSEGEVMLVPMLQALYIRIPVLTTGAEIEHLDTLAHVRCELGIPKDSEDATMLSLRPRTWSTLHTLRVIFDSRESRESSRKILNYWSSSFTREEAIAIHMLRQRSTSASGYCADIFDESFVKIFLSNIKRYKITSKGLHVGVFFWVLACRFFELIFY